MIELTREEQEMLDGKQGRLVQVALENIVRYGEVLGAKKLCRVTKATVFCGNHHYQAICDSPDFHEVFTKMNLARNERIPFDHICPDCYAQSCVSPCDLEEYKIFGQSKEFFERNQYFLEESRKAGVTIAGTCSPYLTGWIPVRGEHFVTTESSMTTLGNSIWGACCNADGIEAAFWSAICGRTPYWGFHVPGERYGTHLFHIEADLTDEKSWDVLGAVLGKKLPRTLSTPVITGNFEGVDFVKLKQFMVSLSITSNCRMCHIVGITPEAPTVKAAFMGHPIQGEYVVKDEDITAAYHELCDAGEGKITMVSLGCPHYDVNQIKKIADYIQGKKVHPDVLFMIWTVYPIKKMAEVSGYVKVIEEAGGHIFTSSCPTTIGAGFLDPRKGQVYDSMKQSDSVRSDILEENRIYYTDPYHCVDAAVAGEWKEELKWRP